MAENLSFESKNGAFLGSGREEYSFFGCLEDIDDPLEDTSRIDSNILLSKSFDGIKESLLETEQSNINWNKVPDLYQNWRLDRTQNAYYEAMRLYSLPSWDSNLVTVGHTECIIYSKIKWEENDRSCASCRIFKISCTSEHGWCRCKGVEHLISIQSPNDVKRLRTVRNFLSHIKGQTSKAQYSVTESDLKPRTTCLVNKKPIIGSNLVREISSQAEINSQVKAERNNTCVLSRHDSRNLTLESFSQPAATSKHNFEADRENISNDVLIKQKCEDFKRKPSEQERCEGVEKAQHQRNPKHSPAEHNNTHLKNANNSSLKITHFTPVSIKHKCFAKIEANCSGVGKCTPDRLEDTKLLRAKIREEALMRLKKDTGKIQRPLEKSNEEMKRHIEQLHNKSEKATVQNIPGSCDKSVGTSSRMSIPKPWSSNAIPSSKNSPISCNGSISPSLVDNREGSFVSIYPHIKEVLKNGGSVNHRKSEFSSLSMATQPNLGPKGTDDVALTKLKMPKESEEMAGRITTSRGFSKGPSPLTSQYFYGIDNCERNLNTGSFEGQGISMFKEFVPNRQWCF